MSSENVNPKLNHNENEVEVEHNPVPQESSSEGDEEYDDVVTTNCDREEFPESDGLIGTRKNSTATSKQNEEKIRKRLPRVNVPEKIILCIDLSSEINEMERFKFGDGTQHSTISMIKRILEIFIHGKSTIDKRHEFALLVLKDTAVWLKDFSNNPREVITCLDDLVETNAFNSFDLSSFFDLVNQKVKLPIVENSELFPPPYIVRCVFIYGRSQCVPEFLHGHEVQKQLMESDYFFLDIFYIHLSPNESNKCEVIFNVLCDLDERGTSYIMEVCKNATKFHDGMAKLLAHPLQRPLQSEASYKFTSCTSSVTPSSANPNTTSGTATSASSPAASSNKGGEAVSPASSQ